MHDEVKENVLLEEFDTQTNEGIEKFGHGIGADFGNLLQFIDNAKKPRWRLRRNRMLYGIFNVRYGKLY